MAELGFSTMPMEQLEKKVMASFQKALSDSLSKSGMSAASILASTGIPEKELDKALANAQEKAFPDAGGSAAAATEQSGFDFQLPTEENAASFDDGMSAIEDLNINAGEIAQNSNGNIFQMITTRYMKTAYPIIFEEQSNIQPSVEEKTKK